MSDFRSFCFSKSNFLDFYSVSYEKQVDTLTMKWARIFSCVYKTKFVLVSSKSCIIAQVTITITFVTQKQLPVLLKKK